MFSLGWGLVAAFAAAASGAAPDFSGHWELHNDGRSVPRAELTPKARAATAAKSRNDLEGLRWCRIVGMPAQMDGPLNIRQAGIETVLVSPMNAVARHLYTDGRSQIDPADFDPTTVGHSVAHWDGDALVVDTIGFSDRGLLSIPGGGYRSATSHLTERYRLLEGGQRLAVSFTWTDPAVFARPHSYEFHYVRSTSNTAVTEWPCDPEQPGREAFFAPALQSPSQP